METKPSLSLLFIGNSHTYVNDMPLTVRRLAEDDGYDCRVTMIAHGGWFLAQHAGEPDVRFDILYGGYDYVILQEHAHPFGPVEKYRDAALALNRLIREAGSIPVFYETWSMKAEPEMQAVMNRANREIAREIGAVLAPVGKEWQPYRDAHPDTDMYAGDGAHASAAGSAFAAAVIWRTIRDELASRGA
ncbi:MAG: hypothetical protein K6A33_09210 [Clostridiales bacterium]|nr:hypothetical protein [Clostridiales bacterium]